ncbi:zinc-binding dehydrogenase, partial [Chloroflexota bacterium]
KLQVLLQEPGLSVAVAGVGGLGHLALQFAHKMGCELTAISTSLDKREQALAFGADHFIDSADQTAMQAAVFAFDLLICTANNTVNLGALFETIKKRGRLILLGFPDANFNSTPLVAHDLTISGSLLGSPDTMRQMLAFAHEHHITPMIEMMTMSRINEAIRRVQENKARYRIVLTNQS